jgi:hypothetical protein
MIDNRDDASTESCGDLENRSITEHFKSEFIRRRIEERGRSRETSDKSASQLKIVNNCRSDQNCGESVPT